jgi:hypothetical protein
MDLATILEWILHPIKTFKQHRAAKKRLKELKARDPFIYK